jgi:dCTP diphosphatase
MKKGDVETTLQELKDLVVRFREERNWGKHHTPKNLAMSIAIEAAELMEHFQWDEYTKRNQEKIAEELADILIYCFYFADTCKIDIATAYRSKLAASSRKYPVELFNEKTDSPDAYHKIKQAYRQQK